MSSPPPAPSNDYDSNIDPDSGLSTTRPTRYALPGVRLFLTDVSSASTWPAGRSPGAAAAENSFSFSSDGFQYLLTDSTSISATGMTPGGGQIHRGDEGADRQSGLRPPAAGRGRRQADRARPPDARHREVRTVGGEGRLRRTGLADWTCRAPARSTRPTRCPG